MQDIVNESNRYAKQMMGDDKYQEWTPMTVPELKACILMGITKLPAIDDYWKKDPLLHYDPIASRITRERFRDIRRYLHFVDNTTLPTSGSAGRDRLAKIRPLITDITTKCQQLYNPHQDVAVDEAMIKFQGRSTLKQYVPKKPIKRGIKVWVLTDSDNGYFHNLQVYTGKEESAEKVL